MAVDSHIQIPKGILKYFSESSGRVYYLDVSSGKIGLAGAGVLGTEHGYYSEEQEQYLNKEIETPFASLAAKVRAFLKDNKALTLSLLEEKVLKRYITAAMARSQLSLDAFLSASFTADLFTDQQNHDDLVYLATKQNNGIVKILDNHFLAIMINKTEVNLVVPRNCFYVLSSRGYECIVAPISPQCALCLLPQEYAEQYSDVKEYRLFFVEKTEDISFMNCRALMYEYMYNKTFVASATRKELDELATFRNERKEDLEALWNKVHK